MILSAHKTNPATHKCTKLALMTASRFGHFGLLALQLIALWFIPSCGLDPGKASLSDPRLQPLLKAMDAVDRAGMGFTPVATNAQITIEMASGRTYDAMLHVYGETSRSIAFRKTNSGYRWIFEQESHQGPGWYQTVDGTFREYILVEYQTERVDGVPTNQLWIRYTGSDTNLSVRELTLAEIKPVLAEWQNAAIKPQPPDLGVGFDPGPAMFTLLMVFALIAAFCLGLVMAGACLGVFTISVAAGIVSTSVLLGFLHRSASTGFRALFLQLGALAGLLAGAVGTAGIIWITKGAWDSSLRWAIGLALGFLSGILFAYLFNAGWSRIAASLAARFQKSANSNLE